MIAPALQLLTQGQADPGLLSQIAEEVDRVEEELRALVASDVRLVHRVGKLILEAGGKRLRPAFVILAARSTGRPFDEHRARSIGACMELIHMATLIHDDVIDESPLRRGRPTASAENGNTAAVLSGDVLMARAMFALAQDGDVEIMRAVSEAVIDMAEGEVRELEVRGDFDLDAATHLSVLQRKTASFIEACCRVGAILAGADGATREALRQYGHHVGMAFQIVDDLLDYRGDRAKTGKSLGTDFRDGQATLPLIYLRDTLSDAESNIARRRFGNGPSDDELRMIADWMDTRGAFTQAEADAEAHIAKALGVLDGLPGSASRDLLETVAEYVVRRQG